jgi:hypothetical protein
MAKETGIKYSEYDEDYFAMIIANPYIDGMNINPVCSFPKSYNGHSLYEPKDETLKNVQFMDFLIHDHGLYVSENIKKQLDDIFPTKEKVDIANIEPMFFDTTTYFKSGDEYKKYFYLYCPRYKFMDKSKLSNIHEYPDSTEGLETITYIVLKASAIKKVPEQSRTIFEMDFHSVGWLFCLKNIKEKIESTGANGIQFEKSKDRNWYQEPPE